MDKILQYCNNLIEKSPELKDRIENASKVDFSLVDANINVRIVPIFQPPLHHR